MTSSSSACKEGASIDFSLFRGLKKHRIQNIRFFPLPAVWVTSQLLQACGFRFILTLRGPVRLPSPTGRTSRPLVPSQCRMTCWDSHIPLMMNVLSTRCKSFVCLFVCFSKTNHSFHKGGCKVLIKNKILGHKGLE